MRQAATATPMRESVTITMHNCKRMLTFSPSPGLNYRVSSNPTRAGELERSRTRTEYATEQQADHPLSMRVGDFRHEIMTPWSRVERAAGAPLASQRPRAERRRIVRYFGARPDRVGAACGAPATRGYALNGGVEVEAVVERLQTNSQHRCCFTLVAAAVFQRREDQAALH